MVLYIELLWHVHIRYHTEKDDCGKSTVFSALQPIIYGTGQRGMKGSSVTCGYGVEIKYCPGATREFDSHIVLSACIVPGMPYTSTDLLDRPSNKFILRYQHLLNP